MVKMVSLKCPVCGGELNIEENRKQCFCQYCGHKMLLDDGSVDVNVTHTYHKVDDARLKEAEVDKLIRLKELEIKQKKIDKKAKSRSFRAKLGVILLLVGAAAIGISRLMGGDEGFFAFGFFSIIGAMIVGYCSMLG